MVPSPFWRCCVILVHGVVLSLPLLGGTAFSSTLSPQFPITVFSATVFPEEQNRRENLVFSIFDIDSGVPGYVFALPGCLCLLFRFIPKCFFALPSFSFLPGYCGVFSFVIRFFFCAQFCAFRGGPARLPGNLRGRHALLRPPAILKRQSISIQRPWGLSKQRFLSIFEPGGLLERHY